MTSPSTFQAHLFELDQNIPEPEIIDLPHGMRFCWHRHASDREGAFYNWSQITRQMKGLAQWLREKGIQADDTVVIHCLDQHAAFLSTIAVMYLGAIPSCVAELGKGSAKRLIDQFHAVVSVAQPTCILSDREFADICLEGYPQLPPVHLIDDIPEADDCEPLCVRSADDICFLQFTSGSTSLPKGVVVTQEMVLENCKTIFGATNYGPKSRYCGWLPIYHDMSMVGGYLMVTLYRCRGCFFPTSRFGRRPDLWMDLMSEERSTFSSGPNFAFDMVNRIAKRRPPKESGYDLSAVDGIVCGSEPIDPIVVREFNMNFAEVGMPTSVMPAFGMAECTLMATCAELKKPIQTVRAQRQALENNRQYVPAQDGEEAIELVDCGAVAPGMECSIVIADNGELQHAQDGEVGELCLAGPSVLTRYYRLDADIENYFYTIADKCWFRTGDLSFCLNGRYFICGRIKDMIIHNGVNYYPADMEQMLVEKYGDIVRRAVVVDMRENLSGPFEGLGVIFEESSRGLDFDQAEEDVAAAVRAHSGLPVAIAKRAWPERIPRTTSGKIVREAVRSRLRDLLSADEA